MNKISVNISLLSGALFISTAYAYIPEHKSQFIETGMCSECDLSGEQNLQPNTSGQFLVEGSNLSRSSMNLFLNHDHQFSCFKKIFGIELNIWYADLSYSDFSNSNLESATFIDNNLTGSDFTNTNLKGASFIKSNLYQAKITEEQLSSVSSLCDTILPDGTSHDCNIFGSENSAKINH